MAAGHYVSNHTMLKIKVELAHPLITPERVAAKEPIPTTPEVSYIFYCFSTRFMLSWEETDETKPESLLSVVITSQFQLLDLLLHLQLADVKHRY